MTMDYTLTLFSAVAALREGLTIAQYDPSMQCEVWMRQEGNRFVCCYGEGSHWRQAICFYLHSPWRVVHPSAATTEQPTNN